MLKSMTGYGRAQKLVNNRDITVEIRTINHRYFEFYPRIPRGYNYLEEKLKTHIQKNVQRGKVDVSLTITDALGDSTKVEMNLPLARAYIKSLRDLCQEENLHDDLSISVLAGFSDLFTTKKESDDEDIMWESVRKVCDEAIAKLILMREAEGDKLREDISSRLITVENFVNQVEILSPEAVESYRRKLYDKIADVLHDRRLDEQRILTEAAVFAEKTAVNEETVRLKSHIAQCRQFLSAGGPVGRKLDFLLQEFNRETNTIGSKSQDITLSKIVVEMKSELEKIREQVQNIE